MTRFLKIWVLLFVVNFSARISLGYLLFGLFDVRDSHVFQLLTVPTFQAIVLGWITEQASFRYAFEALKKALARQRIIAAFFAADLLILVVGWAAIEPSHFSLGGEKPFALYYSSLKMIVAGSWIMYRIDHWSSSIIERLWFGILGVGLCLYGLLTLTGWSSRLPEMMPIGSDLLLSWIVVDGLIYGFIIAILLKTSGLWQMRSESAALFLNAAIAFALLAALPALLNTYNYRQWKQPWFNLYRSFEFLAIAFVWLAVLDLRASVNLSLSKSTLRSTSSNI